MQITLQMYLIVLPLVFLAAAVDAIAGGGGLISLPAYTLAGLDYDFASGNNKFSSMFGSLTATIRYYRSGKLLLVPACVAAAAALPGSWIGTRTAMAAGSQFMLIFMLCAIPVVGALVLLRRNDTPASKPIGRGKYPLCAAIGLVVGFYDGFFGPGAGTFLILLFTHLLGMDMVTASATAKPVNLFSNVGSLVTRIAAGNVLYALALPAMACSILGGWLGAKLALTRGACFIRAVMLAVLLLLTLRLAIELL
ncbi:MAG: TSUP family transporter [Clostridia bacterium]|nr:TSUP family transporter [Clostridia bacterium]